MPKPKQPSVVFFSKKAAAIPSMAPVIERLDSVFISNRAPTLESFQRAYPDLAAVRYRRLAGPLSRARRLLRRANVIVSGSRHGNILDRYRGQKVMLFHGTFRYLARAQIKALAGFDHVLFNGPRMEAMYQRYADSYPVSYSVPGYTPFSDFPNGSDEPRRRTLLALGLDPERRTILYTPARAGVGSWITCAEALARQLPKQYNLIMRPHPSQTVNGNEAEEQLFRTVRLLLHEHGNATHKSDGCTFPDLLGAADMLVSDGTSPTEEFLLYQRPQIIIETYARQRWAHDWRRDGLHDDDIEALLKLYDTGPCFPRGQCPHWGDAAEQLFDEQENYREQQQEYFRWAFGEEPRAAADRVAAELLDMAGA